MASDFLKISSLVYVVYISIVKAIGQSYQDNVQTYVYMFSVAMETLTDMVKMSFFAIFIILLLFLKLLKISIWHQERTNTKLLL